MRRPNRPTTFVLLVMAVLCSPAGVCVIDGVAATVQTAAPAHAHACCKSVDGTFIAAADSPCCTEQPTGVLNAFRFALQKQTLSLALDNPHGWMAKPLLTDRIAFDRRAPLVLRI